VKSVLPIGRKNRTFKRSIGEVTDIVEKEMYTLMTVTEIPYLAPEGTAGCLRACLEHGCYISGAQVIGITAPCIA